MSGCLVAAGLTACASRAATTNPGASATLAGKPDAPEWAQRAPLDPERAFYACGSAPSVPGEDWSVAWRNAFIDGAERLRADLSDVLVGYLGEASRSDGRLAGVLDEVLPAVEKDRSSWMGGERWYVLVRLTSALLADAVAQHAAAGDTSSQSRERFLEHLAHLTRTPQGRWVVEAQPAPATSTGTP